MTVRLTSFIGVWLAVSLSMSAQDTLRLDAFLRQVELSHPSLRMASYEPDLAEAEIRNALGRFDPRLSATFEYKDKSGADKVNLFDANLELPLDMLFGPKIKAQYSRGLGFQLDPEHQTSSSGEASIGVSLPLFQGIFTDTRRNNLRKAMLRPDIAQAQYRMDRNNLLRSAALRYWDWSEAVASVKVMDTILALAEQRAAFITRRAAAGESAWIDSVDIMQEVLRRRGERLRALRVAEQAAVDAAVFLWTTQGAPDIVRGAPTALPEPADTTLDVDQLIATARDRRPELRRATLLQRTSELDRDLARELLRPFIEADAGVITYDVAGGISPDVKFGIRVDQPLFFRSATAQEQIADITVQRADWTRTLVDRTITADVQMAVIAVDRSKERLRYATDEARLAWQMVEAERRKFDVGDADLLSINLRERFLADALLRLVAARADVARALVALAWSTGSI